MGCRVREPRSSLLRTVLADDGTGTFVLVPDEAARLPGRGAWLHPDLDCLQLAERRAAFGRALRHAGPLDTAAVRAVLAGRVPRAADQEERPG